MALCTSAARRALADLFAGRRALGLVDEDRTVAGVAQPDARFDAVA